MLQRRHPALAQAEPEAVAVVPGAGRGGDDAQEPVGERLGPPDHGQAGVAVARGPGAVSLRPVLLDQPVGELDGVAQREVHALAAGGSDQVRGVADEEHPPVLHRRRHPHPQVEDVDLGQVDVAEVRPETPAQLVAQARGGPVGGGVAGRHLEVEPGDVGQPAHVRGVAPRVGGVDGVVDQGRHRGADHEEPHGVVAVVDAQVPPQRARHRAARAVAPDDGVGGDLPRPVRPGHRQPRTLVVLLDGRDPVLEEDRAALVEEGGGHPRDQLVLREDVVRAAAGDLGVVDDDRLVGGAELAAPVLGRERQDGVAEALRGEHLHRPVLDDAGLGQEAQLGLRLGLDDRRRHPRPLQEPGEHQPRGAGADDDHVRTHGSTFAATDRPGAARLPASGRFGDHRAARRAPVRGDG